MTDKDYNYFQVWQWPKEWAEILIEQFPKREPAPPGIVRDTDTGELHVDGGYWADGGFSVELSDGYLSIASDRYEETASIPVEKVPLLLNAIRLVMEQLHDAPGVYDSGPVVGGDAPDGAAQPPVLPAGRAAQAERPHGS